MIKRICLNCNKEFKVHSCRIKEGRGKFCSKKCQYIARKNYPIKEEHREKMRRIAKEKGYGKWMIGRSGKNSPRWKESSHSYCKVCNKLLTHPKSKYCKLHQKHPKGEENSNWKGDKVGYHGIHRWLISNYGKADHCENSICKSKSKRYEWAKIHNKPYARKRKYFMQLCYSCHTQYDKIIIKGWITRRKKK